MSQKIFPGRVLCAPIAGYTSADFRLMLRKYTNGLIYTEMCSAHAIVNNPEIAAARIYPFDHPIALQIYGSVPERMARAASVAERIGADVIDINMGCSRRIITKQGAGAALLRNTQLAKEIINAVKSAVSVPVSVKTRLGWQAFEPAFFEELNTTEIDFITVHGRTASAGFSGAVEHDAIAKIRELMSIPVIGNGDIFTPEQAKAMIEKTGCYGVMLGRGMLGRPWFVRNCISAVDGGEYINKNREEILAELYEHAQKYCEIFHTNALKKFRHHIYMYIKGFRKTQEVFERIRKIENLSQLDNFISWFLSL